MPKTKLLSREHLIVFRRLSQSLFTVFCLYSGWQFFQFHQWAIGKSAVYIQRPPSVEAFLPISALLGLKRLLFTGQYDPIHPAGLTIFIAALTIALLVRKGFCGWICPVGFTSNLAEKAGVRFKTIFKLPFFLDIPLLSLKYILLFFFIYLIAFKMNLASIDSFLRSPYNITVDAKMLYFFIAPGKLAATVMIFLLMISFVIKNFWCRYLCPYGALLGILACISPFAVKRDSKRCIDCKKCDKICPALISVSDKSGHVRSLECIGCLDCVSTCPQEDCLTVRVGPSQKVSPYLIPFLTIAIFLLFWLIAVSTGHWHNSLPAEIMKRYYEMGV
nr:4Fe-4S binding protein [Desulfobulbaceae bacterium]